ncbi:MAG: Flp family type IVb pilin [Proteobacteria bacterium]|nr:Flp family type IVb pilin [Pseudomonadota bacterium]
MKSHFSRLWKDESAANAVEYGIIASLIAVGIVAVLIGLRGQLRTLFNAVIRRTTVNEG